MADYIIFTDSACDIPPSTLKEWGVPSRELTFRFEDDDKEYSNLEMKEPEFYERMRNGGIAKTAAVNPDSFVTEFEKILSEGKDILYLGFSSGLSTTFNSARIAKLQLADKYPERKIEVVDTLAASAGFGLLLHLVLEKKNAGATLEEAAEYANAMRGKICHWFTVDDLVYLKRGGRVSPTVAFVGNLLSIKPVLHVDDEGHLIKMSQVRGRRNAIAALAEKYTELADDPANSVIYISHGDCAKDAELLSSMIKEKHGAETALTVYVGPVIGAHSGPGTLALFFVGKER